jgi:hypothetical protein
LIDIDRPELRLAEIRSPDSDPALERAWRDVAMDLGMTPGGDLRETVRNAIIEVSERMHWACWSNETEDLGGSRYRAQPIEALGRRLLADFEREPSPRLESASKLSALCSLCEGRLTA